MRITKIWLIIQFFALILSDHFLNNSIICPDTNKTYKLKL